MRLGIAGLALGLAVLSHRAVTVWHSELTLWAHACRQAPWKDRPRVNYAKALYADGRTLDAYTLLAGGPCP